MRAFRWKDSRSISFLSRKLSETTFLPYFLFQKDSKSWPENLIGRFKEGRSTGESGNRFEILPFRVFQPWWSKILHRPIIIICHVYWQSWNFKVHLDKFLIIFYHNYNRQKQKLQFVFWFSFYCDAWWSRWVV